jgi:hypothetical protein
MNCIESLFPRGGPVVRVEVTDYSHQNSYLKHVHNVFIPYLAHTVAYVKHDLRIVQSYLTASAPRL